ncbi:alpha/beta hydrolase [Parafrankia sp. FMc2]|uniref:alpha/beta hydrolase n=1 Tax=Parafrankia sp. FMc2 TaxID=3233196 RepID=UPI0034D64B8A
MTSWRDLLDPDYAEALGRLPAVDFVNYAAFRAASDAAGATRAAQVDTAGLSVEDREVWSAGASARVRVYRGDGASADGEALSQSALSQRAQSRPAQSQPALLHLHGGGFVCGMPDSSHARMVELARELGVVVVSVDYRRSPEHPYPAPLDDCVTALRWLVDNADVLGVDRDRMAVHGESAGGTLAAALALRVRGEIDLCFQYLSVPITDDRLDSPSQRRFTDTPIWSRAVGEVAWRHYLGELKPGSDDVPILAAPGRAGVDELRGLPPAYIAVMELDPLCDEGLAYAAALAEAGVSVEAHRFPGAFHAASTSVPDAVVSRRY